MTPANDDRPAAFDRAVVEYLPGLRAMASRLGFRGDDADELVNDTVLYALEHWKNYREGGRMWSFLAWQMRGIISNRRARKSIVIAAHVEPHGCIGPNQEDFTDLSSVLRRIGGRDGSVLLRRAMGDELKEIASDMGLSRERVRQLECVARARLRAAA